MSTALALPPHAFTLFSHHYSAKNPYRARVETGGFLAADPATPHKVAFVTGPGPSAEHTETSLYITRSDVEAAVETAGFVLVGDWHVHPEGTTTEPSPDDQASWRSELRCSPRLDSWASVIVQRAGERWGAMSVWRTTCRRGGYACEPITVTPGLTDMSREFAASLAFQVNRSALVEPWTWTKEPTRLRRDLAVLDVAIDIHERVQLKELNARLERLGIRGTLKPLSKIAQKSSAARVTSERAAGETIIHGDGTVIRRPGIGQVLGVR